MISKRDNQPETKIIFVGRFMMTATAIFNANGFPDIARREVEVCANRFALFLYNSTLMTSAIQTELSEFISALKPYEDDLKRTCKSHPDLRTVAYSDGLLYLNALHSFLYSLKSFLDVFARLVCKLINPSATPTTFKSKGVALANWVERSAPNSFPDRLRLKELILVQSRGWISEAVDYRDTLAHRREIKGMVLMNSPISEGTGTFGPENVVLPRLLNGQSLVDYCAENEIRLGTFLDAVIALLPNVKLEMIEPWQSSQRYKMTR